MANEVAKAGAPVNIVEGYSSIVATDVESAKVLYTALSNAESLKENVETPLKVKDVIVQPIQSVNDETGVMEDRLLTTLITEDGKAYASNSNTVASDVRNLMTVLGEPGTKFWVEPVTVVAKSVKTTGSRAFITLTLA